MAAQRFKGRAAVVTGGSSGIGAALCRRLALSGIRVVIADVNERSGLALETDLRRKHNNQIAKFVSCDVTKTEDLKKAIDLSRSYGGLALFVNNAGIAIPPNSFYEKDPESWRKMIDINLTGVVDGCGLAVQELQRTGNDGVIVNVASMAGMIAVPSTPVYNATKSAVIHLTRSLAHLGTDGIRVCCICPTFTDTPLIRNQGEEVVSGMRQVGGGQLLVADDVVDGIMMMIEDETQAGSVMRVTLQKGWEYVQMRIRGEQLRGPPSRL